MFTNLIRTGKQMAAVALLLAISVMLVVMRQARIMMAIGGKECRPERCCPSQFERPEAVLASDKAYPLPYIIRKLNNQH